MLGATEMDDRPSEGNGSDDGASEDSDLKSATESFGDSDVDFGGSPPFEDSFVESSEDLCLDLCLEDLDDLSFLSESSSTRGNANDSLGSSSRAPNTTQTKTN